MKPGVYVVMEAKEIDELLQLASQLAELVQEDEDIGGRLLGQKTSITANRFRVLLSKYGYADETS
jgi:hypothetical protein